VTALLDRFGLTDLASVQERLSEVLMKGSQFLATQAINIGQTTFELIVRLFILLYLLFFLLRDGDELFRTIKNAVPLGAEA
jgi:predicted PurR-regulated permease PerM